MNLVEEQHLLDLQIFDRFRIYSTTNSFGAAVQCSSLEHIAQTNLSLIVERKLLSQGPLLENSNVGLGGHTTKPTLVMHPHHHSLLYLVGNSSLMISIAFNSTSAENLG